MSPACHCAFYEFDSLDRLLSLVPSSSQLQTLVDTFDESWPDGVTQIREVLEIVQSI